MPRYVPQSIEDIGLEQHLNDTASQHKNNGYAEFLKLMEAEAPKASIARYFGVDRQTVIKWARIYERNLSDGQ